jgi:hypothetical protein
MSEQMQKWLHTLIISIVTAIAAVLAGKSVTLTISDKVDQKAAETQGTVVANRQKTQESIKRSEGRMTEEIKEEVPKAVVAEVVPAIVQPTAHEQELEAEVKALKEKLKAAEADKETQ